MSILWIAVFLAAPTSDSAATAGSGTQMERPVAARSGRELKDAVQTALRCWAKAGNKDAGGSYAAAAREFLSLYHDLQSDSRLPATQREELRLKVRSRLAQLAQRMNRCVARRQREAGGEGPASVSGTGGLAGVLGQQAGAAAGPAAAAGANNAADDYGPELVNLIQTTIAPATWDVNGGPGVIYYWRNQRVLVVSASDDVHDEVGDVLEQLQRAGQ